jgi:hypothetical protein
MAGVKVGGKIEKEKCLTLNLQGFGNLIGLNQ